jgi:transcriptional regulator with XRE-family HTH domain
MSIVTATDSFATRLKRARDRANLSQDELARHVDISKASISKIEQGLTNDVLMSTLFRMADRLSVDPRWLATGVTTGAHHTSFKQADAVLARHELAAVLDSLPTDVRDALVELAKVTARATARSAPEAPTQSG